MNTRIYSNCEELSIYLFHKITETGDLFWLVDGYYEGKTFKIKDDLNKIWEDIYTEYCDLTDDNQSFIIFNLRNRISFLEMRIYICSMLILRMASDGMSEELQKKYADALREWQVPYRTDTVDTIQLEKAQRFLKATKNELELKQNDLESMKGGEPIPLLKQVVMAEQALGRNKIDPKKTSVKKWVYMMQTIEQINQNKKRSTNG